MSVSSLQASSNMRVDRYLKASPLPPAPLAVEGFLVAGQVVWQCYDWLAGLGFAVWVLFC